MQGWHRCLEQRRAATLCPAPTLIHGYCFPVPFPGVKQEQLSPRSQASQPESLVLQPSQEGSILRGEEPAEGSAGSGMGGMLALPSLVSITLAAVALCFQV